MLVQMRGCCSGCPLLLPGLSACAYAGQADEHAAYRPPPSSESRLEPRFSRHGLAHACRPGPCPAGHPSLLVRVRRRRRCRRTAARGGGARAGAGGLSCQQQCGAQPARTARVSSPLPAAVAAASCAMLSRSQLIPPATCQAHTHAHTHTHTHTHGRSIRQAREPGKKGRRWRMC